jgi:hypothetical protein
MPTYYDDINIYNDYYKHTRIKAATLSPAHGVAAGNALLKHADMVVKVSKLSLHRLPSPIPWPRSVVAAVKGVATSHAIMRLASIYRGIESSYFYNVPATEIA